MRNIRKIEEIAYHRNGISGMPFHVVKFLGEAGPMLGVVFPIPEEDIDGGCVADGCVAVFQRTLLACDDIEFGSNSWRGDHYEAELRAAIKDWSDRWKERLPAA